MNIYKERESVRRLAKNIASGVVQDSGYTPYEKYAIATFLLAMLFVVSCAACLYLGFAWGEEHMHYLMQINPSLTLIQ